MNLVQLSKEDAASKSQENALSNNQKMMQNQTSIQDKFSDITHPKVRELFIKRQNSLTSHICHLGISSRFPNITKLSDFALNQKIKEIKIQIESFMNKKDIDEDILNFLHRLIRLETAFWDEHFKREQNWLITTHSKLQAELDQINYQEREERALKKLFKKSKSKPRKRTAALV